jgi:hypothetical protein
MHTICRAAAMVVSVLPLALSACGISVDVPAASPSPSASTTSQATLTCQEHSEVAATSQNPGPQKVTHDLTCNVTGAPSSETSFTLQYQLKDSGKTLTYGATCSGPLQNGQGACFRTYTEVVGVFDHAMPTVSGNLLPSGQKLKPVTPTMPMPATLTCTEQILKTSTTRLHDLTCKVADAPSSETSFTLWYTLADSTGTTETYPKQDDCEGPLQGGTGTCNHVYVEDIGVFKNPQATVFGEHLPSKEPLGPITLVDPS